MARNQAIFDPAREPDARELMQWTDPATNKNRSYKIELWQLTPAERQQYGSLAESRCAPDLLFRATYLRAGNEKGQIDDKIVDQRWADKKRAEKLGKGYTPVALHQAAATGQVAAARANTAIAREVAQLVDLWFDMAGQAITATSTVAVDALSLPQLALGRQHLVAATRAFQSSQNWQDAYDSMRAFYQAVPTKMPSKLPVVAGGAAVALAKMQPDERNQALTLELVSNPSRFEDHLLRLEAAIGAAAGARAGMTRYEALGVDVRHIERGSSEYRAVMSGLNQMGAHDVLQLFALTLPEERAAFEQNTFGAHRKAMLLHGTAAASCYHIAAKRPSGMRGLTVPATASNGRMMGSGIYMGAQWQKSRGYCRPDSRGYNWMFVVEAAIGEEFVARDSMSHLTAAPKGYHSVRGKRGYTWAWGGPSTLQYDELIVYKDCQLSIKYAVVCR
jgi:hypothetical protein